jgi:hypothetical protein
MMPLATLTLAVWVIATASRASAAVAPDQVVFPTGQSATDVANVQSAIDQGGTVLLKAVDMSGIPTPFEFGSTGTTSLSADVTIVGETIAGRMTTIHGGTQPFRAVSFRPVRSAIRGIHFDAPRSAAVFLHFSNGFEFRGNVVTDVVGSPDFGGTKGQAVWITEFPGGVTGTVTIAENLVERVFADLSYGVAMAGFGATTTIARNIFRGTTDTGILVVGGTQPVWIEDNLIVPGDRPFPGFFSTGNGIFVGQGRGAFYIRRNVVVCGNPFADGIALSGHIVAPNRVPGGSVVERNDVTMRNSIFGGITIYGQIDPSLIATNRVRGNGAYAIFFSSYFGNEQTSSIVFRGNDIAEFRSTVADVFFDAITRDNVLTGQSGTVVDLGVNNRITGFSLTGPAIGPEMEAAQTRKRELLKTFAESAAN